jgi:glycerophosphoryl diester phosphodiesterase
MRPFPLLLGHRGARVSGIVENTTDAFDFALHHGCDGFEFDVRLAQDGAAVVCHNSRSRGRAISRSSKQQLSHLHCLHDILARYSRRAFLDIELKVCGLEASLLDAVREHPPQQGYFVASFSPKILLELSRRDTSVPLGFICDKKKHLPLWRELPIEYVILHYSMITTRLMDEIEKAGKKVFAWTVNRKSLMERLASWGIHGIISDSPERLVKTLTPVNTLTPKD